MRRRRLRLKPRSLWTGLLHLIVLPVVFVSAAGIGLVVHVDLPAGRRFAARALTHVLSRALQGDITIGRFDQLRLGSVHASDIRVVDPEGRRVLRVSELRARANLPAIGYDALFGRGDLTIRIEHARVERAEGRIVPDEATGVPTIARAFTPVSADRTGATARRVRVLLPAIELGRAWVRGRVAGLPTMEGSASNAHGSVVVTPEAVSVDVQRFAVVLSGLGGTDARGTAELHVRTPSTVWTSFDGRIGDLQMGARVRYAQNQLNVTLETPLAEPDSMRALWPAWPLRVPVSGQIEATGPYPRLVASGRLSIGGGQLTASGPLDVSQDYRAELNAELRDFDLRSIVPEAPETRIEASAGISVWRRQGSPVVDMSARTEPMFVAGELVPAIDAAMTYDDSGLRATAHAQEPGLPTAVEMRVHPEGAVDLALSAGPFLLDRAPRIRRYVKAHGEVKARAQVHIENRELRAAIQADVAGFELGGLRLVRGKIAGTLTGPLERPRELAVAATLEGEGASSSGAQFEHVRAELRGPVLRPEVQATLENTKGASVQAKAAIRLGAQPSVSNLALQIKRRKASMKGTVGTIQIARGTVSVQGLDLQDGPGHLRGSVRLARDSASIHLEGDGVDLERVARMLGIRGGALRGTVRVKADVEADRKQQSGHVDLAVGEGSVAGLTGIALKLAADLDGQTTQGTLTAQVPDYGAVNASWNGSLAGSATNVSSWTSMTGSAQLNLASIQLARLAKLLPMDTAVRRIDGQGFAQVRLDRSSSAALPNALLVGGTEGLQVVLRPGKSPGSERGSAEGPETVIRGLDLQLGAGMSGETGHVSGTARLIDAEAALATASGTMQVDTHRLLEGPEPLGQQLSETPLGAVLSIPERSLASLPEPLRIAGLAGQVSGELAISGTWERPELSARATIRRATVSEPTVTSPFDVDARVGYTVHSGALVTHVETFAGGRRVAVLDANGTTPWRVGETEPSREQQLPWSGRAQLALEGLPLSIFAALSEAQVGGQLRGRLVLERTQPLPQVSASIALENASLELTPLGNGLFTLRSDGRILNSRVRLAQGEQSLDARIIAALSGEQGELLRADTPIRVQVDAESYNAVVLRPLLEQFFAELTGSINADISLVLDPKVSAADPERTQWTGSVRGTASVRDGTLLVRELGLELDGVGFDARAEGSGNSTTVVVQNLRARARADKDNVSADARLSFDGFELDQGQASVRMTQVPLVLEGVSQASATGAATVNVVREPRQLSAVVKIPRLTATLPRSTGRSVISLAENEDIHVLEPLAKPGNEAGSEALPWEVAFELGDDVKVTRNDLTLPLTGRPVLYLDKTASLRGNIELQPGGRVVLLGRVFHIDRGVVRFDTADNQNPSIDVTALWLGPSHQVTVSIQGTLKQAQVSLTSDPPLPEPEVVALLLGSGTGEGGDATATGVGVGATLLNELFSETPLGRVELRTSSEQEHSNYTAAVEVSDKVWFEATYQAPDNADRVEPGASRNDSGVSGTVDWRFSRSWSLRSQLGTLGAGFDLLWQYRY
ncbi:MAG: translocation/assembly module TamB domain-containing protein [Polyangiaceae bacterium]|nr:translocation/assembly module TamB domain-containing protein [Polyangiaceae bacterium]